MNRDDSLQPANGAAGAINVWREDYRIRSYEVDCRNRLSILSMFSFMQEAASRHAAALGVSIQQLLAENYTWLLSRLKIEIAACPGWNDQIQVHTWPSGTQQLFALRDFKMNNVKFVEWVVEGVPAATLNAAAPSELEIIFLAEAFHEDQILATCSPQDPDNTLFHHSLTRQQDGRELVRAATKWRKVG
jgi:acyl-ACP thioesterase